MSSLRKDGVGPLGAPIPAKAGIGLRFPHHGMVLAETPDVPWFEAHPENYLAGVARETLLKVRRDYPISLHATGLSLGSADGPDPRHLGAILALADQVEPALMSDHLSWSGLGGRHAPDLLPLPYSEEALSVFAENLDRAQTAFGRSILIENPSVYFAFEDCDYAESGFLGALCRRSGCGVLLDVNNIVVSAANLGEDPEARLDAILRDVPLEAIGEIHLAGHAVEVLEDGTEIRIDHHGAPVCGEVLSLYARALDRLGPRPTLVEWDTDVPSFAILDAERAKAEAILAQADPSRRTRSFCNAELG